jgi:hypothetical protein
MKTQDWLVTIRLTQYPMMNRPPEYEARDIHRVVMATLNGDRTLPEDLSVRNLRDIHKAEPEYCEDAASE